MSRRLGDPNYTPESSPSSETSPPRTRRPPRGVDTSSSSSGDSSGAPGSRPPVGKKRLPPPVTPVTSTAQRRRAAQRSPAPAAQAGEEPLYTPSDEWPGGFVVNPPPQLKALSDARKDHASIAIAELLTRGLLTPLNVKMIPDGIAEPPQELINSPGIELWNIAQACALPGGHDIGQTFCSIVAHLLSRDLLIVAQFVPKKTQKGIPKPEKPARVDINAAVCATKLWNLVIPWVLRAQKRSPPRLPLNPTMHEIIVYLRGVFLTNFAAAAPPPAPPATKLLRALEAWFAAIMFVHSYFVNNPRNIGTRLRALIKERAKEAGIIDHMMKGWKKEPSPEMRRLPAAQTWPILLNKQLFHRAEVSSQSLLNRLSELSALHGLEIQALCAVKAAPNRTRDTQDRREISEAIDTYVSGLRDGDRFPGFPVDYADVPCLFHLPPIDPDQAPDVTPEVISRRKAAEMALLYYSYQLDMTPPAGLLGPAQSPASAIPPASAAPPASAVPPASAAPPSSAYPPQYAGYSPGSPGYQPGVVQGLPSGGGPGYLPNLPSPPPGLFSATPAPLSAVSQEFWGPGGYEMPGPIPASSSSAPAPSRGPPRGGRPPRGGPPRSRPADFVDRFDPRLATVTIIVVAGYPSDINSREGKIAYETQAVQRYEEAGILEDDENRILFVDRELGDDEMRGPDEREQMRHIDEYRAELVPSILFGSPLVVIHLPSSRTPLSIDFSAQLFGDMEKSKKPLLIVSNRNLLGEISRVLPANPLDHNILGNTGIHTIDVGIKGRLVGERVRAGETAQVACSSCGREAVVCCTKCRSVFCGSPSCWEGHD